MHSSAQFASAAVDETHDPALASWIESANASDADFPLQNLPLGRFRRPGEAKLRLGVAIGDDVLDIAAAGFTVATDMNAFLAQGAAARRALRLALSRALRAGSSDEQRVRPHVLPQSAVELALPCTIGDYTDFYTSIHHATSVGRQFRPDNPLLPNYKWVPIGYHGRASSIVPSGTPIVRPRGQAKPPDADVPVFGPSRRLDYELELGIVIAGGNELGTPVPIGDAEAQVAGLALFNDWTARDIQAWEYQPLGPFLAKNFASTLSPWIVTLEALAPFRVPFTRPADDPQPLPYLDSELNRRTGGVDLMLEAWLETAAMRQAGRPAQRLMQSNFRDSYWTMAQLVTHHTVNGCNLRSGDLLGSGTQSGPESAQGGSLLELTQGGRQPITLADGEKRGFLEDGDTVILRGHCARAGFRRIGFGDCTGTILPSR